MPNIQFRNNEQAAKAVYQHILAAPSPVRHLTLRLRNPDDIKFTDWWLVPSRRWPPYEHSRLLFRQSHSTNMERRHLGGIPHTMFTGFHVTKGLGRQLPGIVKDDLMMTPQWYWYEFLNDVQGGVFDRPMQDIAQHTGLPVIVRLELYELNYVPDLTSKIHARKVFGEYPRHAGVRRCDLEKQLSRLGLPEIRGLEKPRLGLRVS